MPFAEYGGDWGAYEDAIYNVFLAEIARARLSFRGERVACRRMPESRNRWAAFWHLIQEGRIEDDRTPDLRRCERIRWVRFVIEQADAFAGIQWWENQRGPDSNTLLWLNEEYLVILGRRPDYWLLRSAYCTDKPHRARSLRKERDDFWEARKG
jgi:hypothetical protein